jgi:phage shock protein A
MNGALEETETGRTRRVSEAAAFRARVEERLRSLEGEIAEVKSRINGLLFFIAGTVIAQALLRVLA